jgi:Ca-activated chloride channel family protein
MQNLKLSHMKNVWILSAALALCIAGCDEANYGLKNESALAYSYASNGKAYDGEEAGDRYTDFGENPFIKTWSDPVSTFGIDADGASYANMRGYESDGYRIPADAVRVEEFINYFNFDYPDPVSENVSIHTETAVCPWNSEHYLLRIGLKGKDLKGDRPSANFVFLIDVSGSMDSEDKIDVLKSGFKRLAEQLTDRDRVAIVTYSGNVKVALRSVEGSETRKIKNAIDDL